MHPNVIVEHVTTNTRSVSLTDCLQKFRAAESEIYGDNIIPPFNLDCGLNLLNSFLSVYNHETFAKYEARMRAEVDAWEATGNITCHDDNDGHVKHYSPFTLSVIAWCLFHANKSHRECVSRDFSMDYAKPFTKEMWQLIMQGMRSYQRCHQASEGGRPHQWLPFCARLTIHRCTRSRCGGACGSGR